MAQSATEAGQNSPTERFYGQYSAREEGNSLVTTVPRALNLDIDTPVWVRVCRHRGRVVFLKAIPVAAEIGGRPGTTAESTEISEEKLGINTIWGTTKKLLTIPDTCEDDCETDRFNDDTEPVIVAGVIEKEVVYLKVIPECLYQQAGSINTDDLIEASRSEDISPH
jgi:hypothetical protein